MKDPTRKKARMGKTTPERIKGLTTNEERIKGNLVSPSYKWIALSNTTLGMLMASINGSILLISLPAIFRGIEINPLKASNTVYLLWLLMGYLIVTAVLVVSLGRVGDIFGRVRMYNLGFAIFSFFSILLSITWLHGSAGSIYLIVMRMLQGVGAAFLFANASAILTDAFPPSQRGLALGINSVAFISGSFIGLILGGLLSPFSWRLVFLVSVPFGLFGTIWAYLKLVDTGDRSPSKIDWLGNATFAIGLVSLMLGITYGILPYKGQSMGWANPTVMTSILAGLGFLALFLIVETRVESPMFHLPLFRIKAFSAGATASLLAALGRGGLQFILIIWLQGIWLPEHGYSFSDTPLWAAIYLVPLTLGFLVAGPVAGILSDRYGARPFTTLGLVISGGTYLALGQLDANFAYPSFALILALNGFAGGLFAAPNQAGVMNSLPPSRRGSGAGMLGTFQNTASVLSIGVFFTLIVIGLSSTLRDSLYHGLIAQGIPTASATKVARLPPVGILFAAFLGYNPMHALLGSSLAHLSQAKVTYLTGRDFFPHLISPAFHQGLHNALDFAFITALVATIASWLRGGKAHHAYHDSTAVKQHSPPNDPLPSPVAEFIIDS